MRRVFFFLLLLLAGGTALAQSQGIITTFAGAGTPGFSGDNGPAVQAQFNFLIGDFEFEEYAHIAFDTAGNLYVPDQANDRVRKISPGGTITTFAGNGITGFSGSGVPATQASLFSPKAVAVDAAGSVYIVDQDNSRVRKVTPDGLITTIAGNGIDDFTGNGGPATQAALNAPGGIAVDAAGNIYISDTFNSLVRKVSPGGIITTYAGDGDFDFVGDGGRAVFAALDFPAGLAVDAAGNLYIADQNNGRVRKVSPDGIITTVAGNGGTGFGGDGGPATQANIDFPADVAFDAAGNLYIADQDNHRIRKVDLNGIITTVAGNGVNGYGGDGGSPLNASLSHPSGLAFDKQGNLYITDHYNYRIRKVTFNPPSVSAAPTALAFAATAGGAAPAPQTVALSNPGGSSLGFAIAGNQPWLTASPAAGTLAAGGSATISVAVSIASLTAGDYSGALTITAPGAAGSPRTVRVSLTVRPTAAPTPTFPAAGVTHAASFLAGPVAPGEIVSIFGTNLGPASALGAALDPATGRLSTARGGVTVLFNDVPGPLFFVRQDQINVEVPYEMAGQTSVRIVVTYLGVASAPVTAPVTAAAPGIFAASLGAGPAALLNQDSTVNTTANPAARGSIVQLYLTGQGLTNPPAVTGQLPQAPLPAPELAVTVRIGGRVAQTTFAGLAPGLAGLLQINAVVPADLTPGDNVSLEVDIGSAVSQAGVTMSVR